MENYIYHIVINKNYKQFVKKSGNKQYDLLSPWKRLFEYEGMERVPSPDTMVASMHAWFNESIEALSLDAVSASAS